MNSLPYQSVFDVVVVGRAAVGLAAALALACTGLRVAMVGPDAALADVPPLAGPSGQDWDKRVFAVSPSSQRLLESLGAWQALDAARIAPVHDMRIWPSAAGRGADHPKPLHFSAWQAGIDALAWIIENRNLTNALAQACRFAGFPVYPSPLEALDMTAEPGAARLLLEDGRVVRARLVVGADGANSHVRHLAGISGTLTDYPQRAIVANFDTELSHRDCAYQWFGEHGVLALLPLPLPVPDARAGTTATVTAGAAAGAGASARAATAEKTYSWASPANGRCSIVWSAPNALADELLAIGPEALAERVQQVAGSMLGQMSPLGGATAWPLRLGRVDALIAPRVALVGDAAHVVHPLAGQGMNLGFGDVQALVDTMRGREPLRDPGERMLLRRYERARAEPVAAMRLATDGLQKLFDPGSPLLQGPFGAPVNALRSIGWNAVASSGFLQRLLISQAVR
jgi:2-octaprenylphenol hydroxylase